MMHDAIAAIKVLLGGSCQLDMIILQIENSLSLDSVVPNSWFPNPLVDQICKLNSALAFDLVIPSRGL